MSESEMSAYLKAASAMLGLPIPAVYCGEVLAAFGVLREQAQLVADFALPREVEAAARFAP